MEARDRLQRLLADGRVTASKRTPAELPRPLRLKLEPPVSVLLEELRDDSQ